MAMALLGKLVKEMGFEKGKWMIASAGCQAISGLPATSTAQFVMQRLGLDLTHHRSKIVTYELLKDFSLILCMENGHKSYIQNRYPSFYKRVYLLSEMVGQDEDIEDPVGQPPSGYQKTVDLLISYITNGFHEIDHLSLNT